MKTFHPRDLIASIFQKLSSGHGKADGGQNPPDPLSALAHAVEQGGMQGEGHALQSVRSYSWWISFTAQALHSSDQGLGRQRREWGLALEEVADLIGREHAEKLAACLLAGKPTEAREKVSIIGKAWLFARNDERPTLSERQEVESFIAAWRQRFPEGVE